MDRLRLQHLYIAFIVILPLVLFWRWVFKGEVLFWGTSLFQFWPWHQLTKTIALSGEWPLWNPLLGNGTPLLANLQTAFFYPFNLLYFVIPVEHGLTLSVILHLILAGLLMFTYTRAIGLSHFAATVSALTYMFSGYVVGRTQFVTMVNAFAWFPLLLLLSERLVTRRSYLNALWLGLILALQFLAGHAQLWFYGLWLIGAYTLFRGWQDRKQWIEIVQVIGQLLLAGGLSVLLTAVQIIPTTEFTLQSQRDTGAEQYFALTYSFWPWQLITLAAPNFFGNPATGNYWGYANYWEDHAYAGMLPLVLAVIALWRSFPMIKPRRTSPDSAPVFQKIAPFFIVLIPVSLILAMGRNTPVYLWVFDFVPGFNFFQAPARLLIWYTIAVSVLAGIGIQIHSLTPQNRKNWRRLLVVGIGILSAGIAGRFALSGRSLTFVNAAITTGILLILAIILILSQPSIKSTTRRRQVWQGAVLLFIAVDLLCFAYPLIPTLPDTIYTSPISTAEYLQTQPTGGRYMMDDDFDYHIKFNEYFRFDTFGPLDIEHWQDFKETLAPNMGIHANLPTTNNDDPLVVAHWQELVDLLKQVDASQKAQLLSLMNVTCFIDDPDRAMWSIINDDAMIAIQRVPNPLPRAYFVSQAQVVETEAKVKEKLRSPYFDPYREVIIMEKGLNLTFQTENTPAATLETVVIKDQSPHRLVLSVDAPTAGLVVLTDTHYPGWQATVDGQPTPIRPANLAFRAVAVEAGTHQIEFLYQPRSFTLGLWISIITLIVVLGIFIGSSIKQKTGEET